MNKIIPTNVDDLKPCPFCGSRPEIYQFSAELKDVGFSYIPAYIESCIRCVKCRASTAMAHKDVQGMYPTKEDELIAIENVMDLWERRMDEIETLKSALKRAVYELDLMNHLYRPARITDLLETIKEQTGIS